MILSARNLYFIFLTILFLAACTKNDDQRRFEDEAFVEPQGITETDASGEVRSEDPDDWRISPMYQGLIVIDQPASPNPVEYISNITLQINLQVPNAINYMGVYSFQFPYEEPVWIDELDQSRLQTFNTITLPANSIAIGGGAGSSGIYRILIYDGNNNLITYGDVRIN